MQGNSDCRPFSSCWCEERPNHPLCEGDDTPQAPIDGFIMLGVIVGITIFLLFKNKKDGNISN